MSNFITKIMAAIFDFNGSRRLRRVKIYAGEGGGQSTVKNNDLFSRDFRLTDHTHSNQENWQISLADQRPCQWC